MGDIAGIPPFGGGGVSIRPLPEPVRPGIPAVEPSLASRGTASRTANDAFTGVWAKRPRVAVAESATPRPEPKQRLDPYVLTGPSPAFQASVLELEQDLRQTIARVEAARSKRESDAAMGRPPEPPEPTERLDPPKDRAADTVARAAPQAERPDDRRAEPEAKAAVDQRADAERAVAAAREITPSGDPPVPGESA